MFLLDSVIMVGMVVWGLIDDKRAHAALRTSPFRLRATATTAKPDKAGGSRRTEPFRR